MYLVDESLYLAHHGIKGQKWGKRNGPPYPLGSDVSTGHRLKKISTARSSRAISDDKEFHIKGLTDKQKKYIKYGAIGVGVALLAVGAGVYLTKSGAGAKLLAKGGVGDVLSKYGFNPADASEAVSQRLTRLKSQLAGKSTDAVSSLEEAIPKLQDKLLSEPKRCVQSVNNKLRHTLESRRQNNCMLCTTAYDLRRRGYDVTAGNAVTGFSTESVLDWYDNVQVEKIHFKKHFVYEQDFAAIELTEKLLEQGDGARGNIMVNWICGGGHSMAYEIRNGQVMIMDGQVGHSHDLSSLLKSVDLSEGIDVARLDTATPKLKYMIDHGLVEVPGFKNKKTKYFVESGRKVFDTLTHPSVKDLPPEDKLDILRKTVGETELFQYISNCQELTNDAKKAACVTVGAAYVGTMMSSKEDHNEKRTK